MRNEIGFFRMWNSPWPVVMAGGVGGAIVMIAAIRSEAWALFGLVLAIRVLAWWQAFRCYAVAIDAGGVTDVRTFKSRHWAWDEVACIATDRYHGMSQIVVCLIGNPYPKPLRGAPQRDKSQAMATLDRIEACGWPVDRRPGANEWWFLDPRSKRAPK